MVGYADNHPADTYRMYDPRTKKVVLSRNIQWDLSASQNEVDDDKNEIIEPMVDVNDDSDARRKESVNDEKP
jgi:hypothetical protein